MLPEMLFAPVRIDTCLCFFFLLIYLILYLKVAGSMLHVPYVPCFSHVSECAPLSVGNILQRLKSTDELGLNKRYYVLAMSS